MTVRPRPGCCCACLLTHPSIDAICTGCEDLRFWTVDDEYVQYLRFCTNCAVAALRQLRLKLSDADDQV